MKIGIVGAGSMGTLFAVYFTHMDIDTVIYEKNDRIVSAMKNGISIEGKKSPPLRIKVSSDASSLEDRTHIFIFVKSYSTEDAVEDIAYIVSQNTIIITLQNGLGNVEKINRYFPLERIVFGTTSYGASKKDHNTLVPGGSGMVLIGGIDTSLVEAVNDLLKHCKITSRVTDNPRGALWRKAIINAAINPIGSLLNMQNGAILENIYTASLQKAIVYEAVDIAASEGINFRHDEMLEATRDVCRKTSKNICSMLQDITAGRQTEIDNITGEIIKTAKKHNLTAPYNESLMLLVKAQESMKKR